MTSFKIHVEMHQKKGEAPSENAEPRQIQTLMQPDGTRTHPKFDEGRMLSEMSRYITHKEQPISMGGCMSFARLVIRGCAQPMYKMIHHRKLVGEIKNQFTTIKNELRAILHIKTIRSQLHLIYGLPVSMVLGTLVLPGIESMINEYYKKNINF
jgi:uncharacterized protein YceK